MTWIKEFFQRNQKLIAIVVLVIGISLALYNIEQRQNREHAKKTEDIAATSAQAAKFDKTKEHAAIIVRGGGPEALYNSTPAPTPTPKVEEEEEAEPITVCNLPESPTPTPTPEPTPEKKKFYLPRLNYIPCLTTCEVDSGHMTTLVTMVVSRNFYCLIKGRAYLVFPAGTKIGCFAKPGYIRDRVEVEGEMIAVYPNIGTEVRFNGIVCDQEFDPIRNEYGMYEKSAGLRGTFVQTDHFKVVRNVIGLFLTTAANTAVNAGGQIVEGALNGSSTTNALSVQVPSAAPFINPLVNNIIDPNQISDSLMVQVPMLKPCYVLNTVPIEITGEDDPQYTQPSPREEDRDREPLNMQSSEKMIRAKLERTETKENDETKPNPNATFK